MSRENIEALKTAFDALADGDPSVFLGITDPDIRLYPRAAEPGVRPVYEGLEGLEEYMVNWYSQWQDYEVEPRDFIESGDQVVVVLRERGRMERGGMELVEDFTHSFTLRDGRIVEWRHHDSYAEALEAVGLAG